jgi:hypothetical protein
MVSNMPRFMKILKKVTDEKAEVDGIIPKNLKVYFRPKTQKKTNCVSQIVIKVSK